MEQELSWESLPGWGCQREGRGLPVRGCQMHQLMGVWAWDREAGVSSWGAQVLQPRGKAKSLAQSRPLALWASYPG